MGRFTVIPQDTFQGLQLDAGVLLRNFNPATPKAPDDADIICATTGGITASCTPAFSDLGSDVDNCPVNMKELKHLDSWECSIAFTSLGTAAAGIKLALGCADVSDTDNTQIIPRRDLKQSDFSDVWWVGDRADGGFVAIQLKNALSTGGFSLKTTKSGKGQTSVTLTGHVSINDQDTMPMVFYSSDAKDPDAAPTLEELTVTSVAGSQSGDTEISVAPALTSGNAYKYKIDSTAASVEYGEDVSSWDDWDGENEITAGTGDYITIVECDENEKAVKAGSAEVISAS